MTIGLVPSVPGGGGSGIDQIARDAAAAAAADASAALTGSANDSVARAGQTMTTVPVIYSVPAQYATINAALQAAKSAKLAKGTRATIQVAAGTYNESLVFTNGDFSFLSIEGADTTVDSMTAGAAITIAGTARAWSITVPITNTAAYSVGDFVLMWCASTIPTTASQASLWGMFKVTAKTASSITVLCTSSSTTLSTIAAGTITDLKIAKIKTIISCGDTHAISVVDAIGPSIKNLGLVCTASAPANGNGLNLVRGTLYTHQQLPSVAQDKPYFGVWGFLNGLYAYSSNFVGSFYSGNAYTNGLFLGMNSFAISRALAVNGSGSSGTSGNGVWALSNSCLAAAGYSSESLHAVVTGAAYAGLAANMACIDIYNGAALGNGVAGGSVDMYAYRQGYITVGASATFKYSTLSPAVNTNGNNNSYIAAAA